MALGRRKGKQESLWVAGKDLPRSAGTVIRKRLPSEIFEAVFRFVLECAQGHRLLKGKTVAVYRASLVDDGPLRLSPSDCERSLPHSPIRMVSPEIRPISTGC